MFYDKIYLVLFVFMVRFICFFGVIFWGVCGYVFFVGRFISFWDKWFN